MKTKARTRSFQSRCKRLRRGLGLKLRLSLALLVAGLFSLSRPRESWPRVSGAFKTWLRWARDPVKTPFWIQYGRERACRKCHLYSRILGTCSSPIFAPKEDRENGCWCHMTSKSAIPESDCWIRELGVDETMGWPDTLRRLSNLESDPLRAAAKSGIASGNDGHLATTRRCASCGQRAAS